MRKTLSKTIATFFGMGLLPVFWPATWTSGVVAVLAWFTYEGVIYWAVLFGVLGFWATRDAREIFRSKDPKPFVMDEACGMMVSLIAVPKELKFFVAAFLLFRLFDAWKPWPINKIDRHEHPWSIVWDDVAAGVLTNLILQWVIRCRF